MKQEKPDYAVVVNRPSRVGEGSIWDSGRSVLYWVDILDGKVFAFNPETGKNREWDTCQAVGTVVPRGSGGVSVALHNGFAHLDLETGRLSPIVDPEAELPSNRFNDGKCDPAGRFWAGTMDYFGEKEDRGALYCLHPDGKAERKISPATISNGLAWSLDTTTMYYVDTGRNNVRAYDYDVETGDVRNERIAIQCEPSGHFDGITIDAEGMLWIAIFGGGGIRRYNPDTGELLCEYLLPVSQVTSVALGGRDLTDLYVTSASHGFDTDQWNREPLAGSLLCLESEIPGIPAFSFAG